MDENVQINDKPLWKQDDRSWISSLYKRAPPSSISVSMPSEEPLSRLPDAAQHVATTTEQVVTITEEEKTSSNKSNETHPRDVYETIKEMLNEEDKFHQVIQFSSLSRSMHVI